MTSAAATAISLLVAEAVGTTEGILVMQQRLREARIAEREKIREEKEREVAAKRKEKEDAAAAVAAAAAAEAAAADSATTGSAEANGDATECRANGSAQPSHDAPGAAQSITTSANHPRDSAASPAAASPAASAPSSPKANALFGSSSPQRQRHSSPTAKDVVVSAVVQAEKAFSEASERANKVIHRLLVHTLHVSDSIDICRAQQFTALLDVVSELFGVEHDLEVLREVGIDTSFALNFLSVLANLCVFEDVRAHVPHPTAFIQIALVCIRHQPTSRRVVHLCLMCIANAALCGRIYFTDSMMRELVDAVIPLCEEAPVVEAWACAMCNVASTSGENLDGLVAADASKHLEDLLLYHGDNDRTVARGYQCLSCLSAAYTGPPRSSNTTSPSVPSPPAT
jgi:hypothetical protein